MVRQSPVTHCAVVADRAFVLAHSVSGETVVYRQWCAVENGCAGSMYGSVAAVKFICRTQRQCPSYSIDVSVAQLVHTVHHVVCMSA